MADAWSPDTAYSPGALVSYNGQIYIRSQYPPTPTSGTAPNVELGTDINGDAIRTWTISVDGYSTYSPTFYTTYFRLVQPPIDSSTGVFAFNYSGEQFRATNAYTEIGQGDPYYYGTTSEWDQAKDNPEPTPDSPICPSESCGVAMQQFGEQGIVSCGADSTPDPDVDRKYYIYVVFNHPLYFRRTIFVTTVIQKTVIINDPFSYERTYEETVTSVVPTDKNYCSFTTIDGDYFVPANAVFEITVPPDVITEESSTEYAFVSRFVSDVSPND